MAHRRNSALPNADQGVRLSLIVTPMLDMAFQILAFFIMTYHPSALEAHVPGSLAPMTPLRNPNVAPKLDNAPGDALLLDELMDAPTIQIKAVVKGEEIGNRTAGTPRQILVKLPLEVAPQVVADADVDFEPALKRLDARLKEIIRTEAASKTHIKIAADGELRQHYLMKVYDAARKAGFEKIHFVPPPNLAK